MTYLQKDRTSLRKSSYKTLLPAESNEQKFASLFPHGWEWIVNRDGQWTTNSKYPLTPRDLIEKWRSPNEIVGVRFGKETSYLMLDIDAGSQYHPQHNERSLTAIRAAMESIGLVRHVALRSSSSNGLHLYFPLPYSINSFKLACAARHALEKAKLTIKDGTIEQFPNPKAFNAQFKGHRLPLQEGSYILNDDLQPYSQTLATFLALWDKATIAQDLELLEEAIAKAPKPRTYQCKQQGKGTEWRTNIEARIEIGWTGKGQTNEMLFQIAIKHRVFDGIDDPNELAHAIATTAKNCQGFYEYSNHTREIESRALYTAQSVMITHYPYGSQASNQNNSTTKKQKTEKQPTAIERITKAIEKLSDLAFSKVREAIAAIRGSYRIRVKTCKIGLKALPRGALRNQFRLIGRTTKRTEAMLERRNSLLAMRTPIAKFPPTDKAEISSDIHPERISRITRSPARRTEPKHRNRLNGSTTRNSL